MQFFLNEQSHRHYAQKDNRVLLPFQVLSVFRKPFFYSLDEYREYKLHEFFRGNALLLKYIFQDPAVSYHQAKQNVDWEMLL